MATGYKAKVFSLILFLIESAFTSKNFVLQMKFFPKAEFIQIEVLKMSGVHTFLCQSPTSFQGILLEVLYQAELMSRS